MCGEELESCGAELAQDPRVSVTAGLAQKVAALEELVQAQLVGGQCCRAGILSELIPV